VALARTEVSVKPTAFIIRVEKVIELGTTSRVKLADSSLPGDVSDTFLLNVRFL
jgi:hypothetical protein